MSVNAERKPAVCTDRLAFAPLTVNNGTTVTYGAVVEIDKGLMTVKKTPKQNSASIYSSGQEYDSYVSKAGGTIDITVPALTSNDDALLFGVTVDGTSAVTTENKDDTVPDVMVIYSTRRSDGKINLYKIMKSKFTNGGETVETSDDSGAKYQAIQISGNYGALIKTGDTENYIKGLDPTEDAATITAWFGTALGGLPAATYPA